MKVALLVPDDRDETRQYSIPEPYFGAAPTALLEGFSKIPDCEIHLICCTQKPLRSPPKIAENIYYHSLEVPKWGWLRGGYIGCVRAIRKKLRELSPDIVHGQGTERYCAISAAFSGYPNVITIHGNMVDMARILKAKPGSFIWLAARLENFSLKRTAGVFCNSHFTEQLVKPRARKVWSVPNALREEFFSPLKTADKTKGLLLNVGVVSANKRQVELLDMATHLHERGCQFELQFIGQANPNDPYVAHFLKKIQDAEKVGYANYQGAMDTTQLVRRFDVASALVHFPKAEAFGLVVAEALSRDLKLFAARVGGVVDIASGIESAELVDGESVEDLEKAIANWLKNGAPLTERTSEIIQKRYHPLNIARRHLEIYREVLKVFWEK